MLIRAALAVLALALPAAAQEIEGNIFTGVSGGAELAIGQDIAALAAECGLTLNVQESAGGVENMLAVRERRLTQFGLVQSDVLEYFRTFQADDPEIARAAEGIRVAFPLYDEEVQVLARRDVAGLAELSGRRVATGAEGSGTALTAGLVLDLAEAAPAERLALAPAEALDALLAGEIDALFHVGGAPAALFADARIDPAAFHLLPLTDPVLAALYAPAELAAGTYPFVTEPVPVVAVKSVLVTFDFDPRANAYQAASCQMVADVSHLIATRIDRLRDTGHPKWRAVDAAAIPPGWQVSGCVLQGLDPAYPFTCLRPDGSVVREGVADEAGEPALPRAGLRPDRLLRAEAAPATEAGSARKFRPDKETLRWRVSGPFAGAHGEGEGGCRLDRRCQSGRGRPGWPRNRGRPPQGRPRPDLSTAKSGRRHRLRETSGRIVSWPQCIGTG